MAQTITCVVKTAPLTSLPNNTWKYVTFSYFTAGYSWGIGTSSGIRIKQNGIYKIYISAIFGNAADAILGRNGLRIAAISSTSGVYYATKTVDPAPPNDLVNTQVLVTTLKSLSAGTILTIRAKQTSGYTLLIRPLTYITVQPYGTVST